MFLMDVPEGKFVVFEHGPFHRGMKLGIFICALDKITFSIQERDIRINGSEGPGGRIRKEREE